MRRHSGALQAIVDAGKLILKRGTNRSLADRVQRIAAGVLQPLPLQGQERHAIGRAIDARPQRVKEHLLRSGLVVRSLQGPEVAERSAVQEAELFVQGLRTLHRVQEGLAQLFGRGLQVRRPVCAAKSREMPVRPGIVGAFTPMPGVDRRQLAR